MFDVARRRLRCSWLWINIRCCRIEFVIRLQEKWKVKDSSEHQNITCTTSTSSSPGWYSSSSSSERSSSLIKATTSESGWVLLSGANGNGCLFNAFALALVNFGNASDTSSSSSCCSLVNFLACSCFSSSSSFNFTIASTWSFRTTLCRIFLTFSCVRLFRKALCFNFFSIAGSMPSSQLLLVLLALLQLQLLLDDCRLYKMNREVINKFQLNNFHAQHPTASLTVFACECFSLLVLSLVGLASVKFAHRSDCASNAQYYLWFRWSWAIVANQSDSFLYSLWFSLFSHLLRWIDSTRNAIFHCWLEVQRVYVVCACTQIV